MGAKVLLVAMLVASVSAVAWSGRERPRAPAPPVVHHTERPWLSREAAAQIVADGGLPGPLFTGLTLGGSAPSAEQRARIAAFAREHDVTIALDVVDDTLVAIRFAVTYGGCCGYEAADVLARRVHRPTLGGACSGIPETWLDDWAFVIDDTYVRGQVDVNRVTLRWQPVLPLPELLEHAELDLDRDVTAVAREAGAAWRRLAAPGTYVRELPLSGSIRDDGVEGGMVLTTSPGGRVAGTRTRIRAVDMQLLDAARARWGRPSVRPAGGEVLGTWRWERRDRTLELRFSDDETAVISARVK